MEKLKVKIMFKSGKVRQIESSDFHKGQFKEWCEKNFIKNELQRYDMVIWNNIFINVGEIELIEEIE